jgi:hypothetical protein
LKKIEVWIGGKVPAKKLMAVQEVVTIEQTASRDA